MDFKKSPAIQELPVISAICEPVEGGQVKVKEGKIKVRGELYQDGAAEKQYKIILSRSFTINIGSLI